LLFICNFDFYSSEAENLHFYVFIGLFYLQLQVAALCMTWTSKYQIGHRVR